MDIKLQMMHTMMQETLKSFQEMLSSKIAKSLAAVANTDIPSLATSASILEQSQFSKLSNAKGYKIASTVTTRAELYNKKDGGEN